MEAIQTMIEVYAPFVRFPHAFGSPVFFLPKDEIRHQPRTWLQIEEALCDPNALYLRDERREITVELILPDGAISIINKYDPANAPVQQESVSSAPEEIDVSAMLEPGYDFTGKVFPGASPELSQGLIEMIKHQRDIIANMSPQDQSSNLERLNTTLKSLNLKSFNLTDIDLSPISSKEEQTPNPMFPNVNPANFSQAGRDYGRTNVRSEGRGGRGGRGGHTGRGSAHPVYNDPNNTKGIRFLSDLDQQARRAQTPADPHNHTPGQPIFTANAQVLDQFVSHTPSEQDRWNYGIGRYMTPYAGPGKPSLLPGNYDSNSPRSVLRKNRLLTQCSNINPANFSQAGRDYSHTNMRSEGRGGRGGQGGYAGRMLG